MADGDGDDGFDGSDSSTLLQTLPLVLRLLHLIVRFWLDISFSPPSSSSSFIQKATTTDLPIPKSQY